VKRTRLFLLIFLFPLLASAQTPTLVQHVSCPNSGSIGSGIGGVQSSTPAYLCPLPEPTQVGNAIVLGFFSDNTGSPTWTVSDDKSNTWVKATSTTDSSANIIAVYYALNVAAGTHMLSVKSSAQTAGFLAVSASEYYNVATSSALDASRCNAGSTSTSIAAGNITPTVSGDLLWQWAADSNVANVASFSAGTIPAGSWLLNGTDILYGNAVQAAVYNSTASLNPTFTSGTAEPFDSCVMALKAATAGSSPTNGFRIVHMYHQQILASSPQAFPVQFPTSGNMFVASFISGGNQISSISSNPANTWSATGSAVLQGQATSQMYYAANTSSSNAMTLSFSRTATGDGTIMLYDVTGAAQSPFDKSVGRSGTQLSIVSSLTTCAGCISPTGVTGGNEIVIGNVGNAWCTATGTSSPAGSVFDTATYDGNSVNGPETVDQNNGWFHLYAASSSAVTVTWNYTCDGTNAENDWAGTYAVFKSASSVTQRPAPPTQLKAVVN
jgi:hypothetical protein